MEDHNWLSKVERLRENISALQGTLSFTSPDELMGAIELGPSVDELDGRLATFFDQKNELPPTHSGESSNT